MDLQFHGLVGMTQASPLIQLRMGLPLTRFDNLVPAPETMTFFLHFSLGLELYSLFNTAVSVLQSRTQSENTKSHFLSIIVCQALC